MFLIDRPLGRLRRMLHIWFCHYALALTPWGAKPRLPRTSDIYLKIMGVTFPTLLQCECGRKF